MANRSKLATAIRLSPIPAAIVILTTCFVFWWSSPWRFWAVLALWVIACGSQAIAAILDESLTKSMKVGEVFYKIRIFCLVIFMILLLGALWGAWAGWLPLSLFLVLLLLIFSEAPLKRQLEKQTSN